MARRDSASFGGYETVSFGGGRSGSGPAPSCSDCPDHATRATLRGGAFVLSADGDAFEAIGAVARRGVLLVVGHDKMRLERALHGSVSSSLIHRGLPYALLVAR